MYRVELWDGYEPAGGGRVAMLGPLVQGSMTRSVDNRDSLTLTAHLSTQWSTQLSVGTAVLRTVSSGGETREWKLAGVERRRGEGEGTVVLRGVTPLLELGQSVISDISTGGARYFNLGGVKLTAAQYVETFALPALENDGTTYVEADTFEDTDRLDLAWDRWTPLQMLNEIENRTGQELEYLFASSSRYTISFRSERGSSAAERLLRVGRNVSMLRWERKVESLATVVAPSGLVPSGGIEAEGIQYAAWQVSAITGGSTGGTVTLADVAEGDGPVAFNDQLTSAAMLLPDASLVRITSASTSHVLRTTGDISSLTTAMRVEIRASTDGVHLTELSNPDAIGTYGRRLATYEDTAFRGEHNLTRNGLFGDWPDATDVLPVQADSSAAGSSLTVKGLPTSGVTIGAGSVLFRVRPFNLSGALPDLLLAADATGSTSGTATLTLVSTAASFIADEKLYISRQSSGRAASGWTYERALSNGTAPTTAAGSIGFSYPVVQRRRASLSGSLSGTAVGAQNTSGQTGNAAFNVTGLGDGAEVGAGDLIYLSTSTGTVRRIMGSVVASTAGAATLAVYGTIGSTDGAGVEIVRPTLTNDGGPNYAALRAQNLFVTNIPHIQGPSWTVRYDSTLPVITMSVAASYSALGSVSMASSSTTLTPPTVSLWDVGSSAALMTATGEDRAFNALEVQEELFRGSTQLTADTEVAIRIRPPWNMAGLSAQPQDPDPFMFVRYVMLSLTGDANAPPIEGSHGARLWQRANRKLAEWSESPNLYELAVTDLSAINGYTSTDEALILGGTVRLLDSQLGIDERLRVVQITHDLIEPHNARVVLARRPRLLTERIARNQPQSRITVQLDDETFASAQVKLGSPNEGIAPHTSALRAVGTTDANTGTVTISKYGST